MLTLPLGDIFEKFDNCSPPQRISRVNFQRLFGRWSATPKWIMIPQCLLILLNQVILWLQKQFSRDVIMKRCSEKYATNLQKNTYVEVWLIKITFQYGCYPVNLLHISRQPFHKNTSRGLVLFLGLALHLTSFVSNSIKSSKRNY